MDRDEVWRAIDAERSSVADLLDELSAEEWETPSLCAGWRVRDVAAHLTLAQMGVRTAAVEILRARGDFNRMIRDSARRRAELPVEELSGHDAADQRAHHGEAELGRQRRRAPRPHQSPAGRRHQRRHVRTQVAPPGQYSTVAAGPPPAPGRRSGRS